jgi:hypothetical protein
MHLTYRQTQAAVRRFLASRHRVRARDAAMEVRALAEPLDRRVLLSFTPVQTPVTLSETPLFTEVADFNRDGQPDLATVLIPTNRVAILLGDGTGAFTQAAGSPIATNSSVFLQRVWVADMNRDAKSDLLSLEPTGVAIHLGNGDGTFMAPQSVATGGAALDVEVADVNRDGLPDLLAQVSDDNNLRVLLGSSGGGFTAQPTVALGTDTRVLGVADFNRDGKPDFFALSNSPNTLRLYLGDGSGGFTLTSGSPIPVGGDVVAGRAGDFNRDGKLDILVAKEDGVDVLAGNGDGSFGTTISGPITVQAGVVSFGDVNADGAIDIISTEFNQNNPNVAFDATKANVYLGLGDGKFALGQTLPDPKGLIIATADLNVDGKTDLISLDLNAKKLTVLLNDQGNRGLSRFATPAGPSLSVGDAPQSTAVVDFNDDGILDILTANRDSDNISVLLGNTGGGYTAAAPLPAGDEPQGITVGDVNLDGFADVLVANFGSATLRILTGDGNGGILGTIALSDIALSSFELADVNLDGKPDILMGDGFASVIHVRLGQGNGTFTAAAASPISIQTDSRANSITVSDFNNDGKPDLVYTDNQQITTSANGVSVNVYLGDGTGSFTFKATYSVPTLPGKTVVADLSGDGKPDIITPTRFDTLSVRLGTGDGTFGAEAILSTGGWPVDVAVADVNRDGKPDVLSVNLFGGDVTVFLGTGTGTFTSAPSIQVGSGPADLSLADLNADGRLDMVVVNSDIDSISLYYGNGTGGFTPAGAPTLDTTQTPSRMASADINGDGKLDFVVSVAGAGFVAGTVRPYLGDGSGGFTAGTPVTVGISPRGLDIADLNGDGKLDIAVPNFNGSTVTVLLGDGAGGFSATGASPIAVGTRPNTVKIADINGDGKPDLTVANGDSNNFTVLLNDGSAGFTAAAGSPFALDSSVNDLAVADINRDGKPDVVTVNGDTSPSVSIRLGNGSGGFTTPAGSPLTPGVTPLGVRVADVNLDGKPDILTADFNGGVSVFLGVGDGTFTAAGSIDVGGPRSMDVADFDGDGKPDMFVTIGGGTLTRVFRGDGTGAFDAGPGSSNTVGLAPQSAVVGDFNGDGLPDVITSNVAGNNLSVLLNRRASATRLTVSAPSNANAGIAFPITMSALFVGPPDSLYSGTVKLISTDPAANLTGGVPFSIGGNVPFSILNDGTRTVNITLNTVGSQTITAIDTVDGTIIGSATIEVIPNRAPTTIISVPTTPTVAENEPTGTSVTTFSTIDPDFSNTFTYTLVSGTGDTDNALFTIDGNRLTSAAVFNFESKQTYSVRVRSTDQGGLFVEQNYTVNITNLNETPTNLTLTGSAIAENQATGTTVGTFSTTDPDTGNTFTYSLASGTGSTDNASFSIVGNQLRAASSFDFESKSSYSVRVRTTDQGGLSFQKSFTITVTDANDAPTDIGIRPAVSIFGQPPNPADLQLSSADINPGNTFTYSLVSGSGSTDNSLFTISGDHLFRVPGVLFDPQTQYSIRIRSTDQGGLFLEKVLTFSGSIINDAPTDLAVTPASIPENQPSGTTIGTFSTVDRNAGNTFIYTLTSGSGDSDNALFAIVDNTLRAAATFNRETRSTYSIRVRTNDNSGQMFEKALAITVTNVNEAPTAVSLTRDPAGQAQIPISSLGSFSSTDPDANDSFTYALVAGAGDTDNAFFVIDGSSLLTAAGFVPTRQSYSVLVRSTDGGGLSTEQAFSLPFATQLAVSSVPINGIGTLPLSPVTVRVTDIAGNLIGGDTSSITLVIASGPAGAVLGGTLTVAAINGIAAFSDLTLSLPGTYTFSATGSGATAGTSASFDITPPDTSLLVERGSDQSTAPDLIASAVKFKTIRTFGGSIVGGTVVSGTLTLRNIGTGTATGNTSVQFFLSDDATVSSFDTSVLTVNTSRPLNLRANRTASIPFNITVPVNINSTRQLLALVNPTGQFAEKTTLNNALALRALPIAAPFTNLTASPAIARSTVRPGRKLSVTLPLANSGNLPFSSSVPVTAVFIDSASGQSTDIAVVTPRVRLQPGKSVRLRLSLTFPSSLAGRAGEVVLTVDPSATLSESITTDNISRFSVNVSPN